MYGGRPEQRTGLINAQPKRPLSPLRRQQSEDGQPRLIRTRSTTMSQCHNVEAQGRAPRRTPQRPPQRRVIHTRREPGSTSTRPRFPRRWPTPGKRVSCGGMEDTEHQVICEMNGWTPVPGNLHPELAGRNGGDRPIIRGGQMLMEQPKEWEKESRSLDVQIRPPSKPSKSRSSAIVWPARKIGAKGFAVARGHFRTDRVSSLTAQDVLS